MLLQSRLKQEIARRGFLPFEEFLASSRPFGAPTGGLLVHYIPSFLVIVLPSSATVYAFAAEVEGYAGQFMALFVAIGLLLLRIREPHLPRPFKALVPAVWLRIALCITLIAAPLFPRGRGSMLSHGAYALVGLAV
jgi:amino acid transporter